MWDAVLTLVAVMWVLPIVGMLAGLPLADRRPSMARAVLAVCMFGALALAVMLTTLSFGYLLAQVAR